MKYLVMIVVVIVACFVGNFIFSNFIDPLGLGRWRPLVAVATYGISFALLYGITKKILHL